MTNQPPFVGMDPVLGQTFNIAPTCPLYYPTGN